MQKQVQSFNVELLYVFLAVADAKSVNKASQDLLQTQPSISKKVRQLERYFGTELFIRSPRGMELTPAGRRLYPAARTQLASFNKLRERISRKPVNLGELNLGAIDSIATYAYPAFFARAFSVCKSVSISNKASDLIGPFNAGKLDIVLMDSVLSKHLIGQVSQIPLFEEPYSLVYAACNQAAGEVAACGQVTATDLRRLKLLMYPEFCPIHQSIIHVFDQFGEKRPCITQTDYSESTLVTVANSNYTTILPESLARVKVSQESSSLAQVRMESRFTRRVSLFSHNPAIAAQIKDLLQ
ncbi:transcriptional regulator [Bombiscardovia nodaiensis]|uniref:Transcriptional regulator n=1 Tax=Bombiscardovia nodaiensis TaxID=2932181 RepID=A0ABN6SC46_9BIFI|nr:transcriptional regulator [Bombiscardovia nodaiensis]